MLSSFYKFPLNTLDIISKREADKCDISASISNFIRLIITSQFGECAFDDSFGSIIWELDFDNLTSNQKLKNIITNSLLTSIAGKERRIKDLDISVVIREDEFDHLYDQHRVKKRLEISLRAVIRATNEPFSFYDKFYIAPLSY
ncbi:GPW/gp25 family protein [Fulvivirga maritima]|uniref:GPW/gp25 family protein n=1 Tax=Fulvivirga maritima TaxID=2904247 RepID=UPI001F171460|nr:GPW/gp25 family protein [Fulvivirga maritima]UII28993.1 GPW/gp25 family protein [Fulvivirga maritima]